MAEKQGHARSNPLATQFMNFRDVRPGKFMELKPAVNSGHTFCDFMETTPKETVIGFFREVIDHIEQARGIRDYHLKVKGSKPGAGFVIHVFYGEDREGPEKIEPGSCISCHGDALLFPGVEGSVLAGECVLAEFSEDQPYVQCSMDAKARAGFIVTPVRHVETIGALEDEELYCLWRVGVRALRSEGLQPVSMIVNHGRYRNLPHLHLKIWVDDGVHRQARLKWNDDRKSVWARLERLTSSSLSKKRAFCPGFERQGRCKFGASCRFRHGGDGTN